MLMLTMHPVVSLKRALWLQIMLPTINHGAAFNHSARCKFNKENQVPSDAGQSKTCRLQLMTLSLMDIQSAPLQKNMVLLRLTYING